MRETIAAIFNERKVPLVVVNMSFHRFVGCLANLQFASKTGRESLDLSIIPVAAEMGVRRPLHRQPVKQVTAQIDDALASMVEVQSSVSIGFQPNPLFKKVAG